MATTTSAALHALPALLALGALLSLAHGALEHSGALETTKQWKLFTYNFLPHAPVNDINFYNSLNILATGIAVGYDRIFIATPKLFSGVPSSVSFVPRTEFGDSPVLQAYPDWSFSTTGRKGFNCSDLAVVSAYRMRIDSCNRLWVLDSGVSRSLEDYEITCPPKILVFDLNTDQVVRRVDFPREVLRGESLFTNLVVDETTSKSGTCDDVFVYITDTVEPAIVVYDSGRDVTWRVSHPAMYPDPDFAQSEILNHRFILMDGVVGLTFNERTGIVYFQPLATDRLFSITKEALRAGPLPQNEVLPVKLVGKKSSQGIGLAVSPRDGSLLFSPLSETAVAAWDPASNRQSVLAYDRERLQFVADLTTSRFDPGVVYAVSSRFHRYFLKNLNPNDVNNRILRIPLPGPERTGAPQPPGAPHLASFALTGLVGAVPHFENLYRTNALDHKLPPPTSYFSSSVTASAPATPTAARSKKPRPYAFESAGVVNYSLRNPFTALNQGESFPPSKENRDVHQKSYLDSLVGGPPAAPLDALYPSLPLSRGYRYGRGLRSVDPEDAKEAAAAARQ